MNASVSAHRWLFRQLADLHAATYEQVLTHGEDYLPVLHYVTDVLDETAQSMVSAVNGGVPELVDDDE